MTLDYIDQKALELPQYDEAAKLTALHKGFDTAVAPVEGKYYRPPANMEGNIAKWLGVEATSKLDDLTPDMYDVARRMYCGTDAKGTHTLGLKDIHGWKINSDYEVQNTRQHAGYAAEVIGTAKENMINKHNGTGITVYRADDRPDLFQRNDPYVDKVRMDSSGQIIERVQAKFVGQNADQCLSKLMSPKFEKYILDGQVDKLEIPKDYYDDLISRDLIGKKRMNFENQLAHVKKVGKLDVAQQIEEKLSKLNKLEGMLERSTVTMEEAVEGVKHPRWTTAKLFAKEVASGAHEIGKKSALAAAGLTMTVSTVDNVSAFLDGEITGEEMVVDIVKETAAAGALGYGTAFVTTAVSKAMSHSSRALLRTVGGSCLPAAVVSFGVEACDSVLDYAQGKIDAEELAYDLGGSAASVAGGMAGGALAGAAIGSVAGPVGTVAGGIVGSVVGCVVASEAYQTAVEIGTEGIDVLGEKVETLAKETTEFFQETVPDQLDNVKDAFNHFFEDTGLPFNL